jgi:hypothetical protein
MITWVARYLVVACWFANQAFAADLSGTFPTACEGPDMGESTTVVTIPPNENVNVFHYRTRALASVIEFCVRETGSKWKLVASRGTDQRIWSLLQSWVFPKAVQIKTRAYANDNGTLYPFKSQTHEKTTYGESFFWIENDPNDPNDQIVYCYNGRAGCPASRRVDFP